MITTPFWGFKRRWVRRQQSEKLPLPIGLICFQGIMVIVAVWMYMVWMPNLKKAYQEFGLELPTASHHLLGNLTAYLFAGFLVANGLFIAVLADRKREESKQSRTWAMLFIVFWMLFLVFSAFVAYSPVSSIRSGGVDIWL